MITMVEREVTKKEHNMVFISHIAEEKSAAIWLKQKFEETLGIGVEIFVASDRESIPSGTQWYQGIVDKILSSKVVILLVSPRSLIRPWINFEAGIALGASRSQIIPVIYLGAENQPLSFPLAGLQGVYLKEPLDMKRIFKDCTKKLGITCPAQKWDVLFNEFQQVITSLQHSIVGTEVYNVLSREQREFIDVQYGELRSDLFASPLPSSGLTVLFAIPKQSSPSSHLIEVQELYDELSDIRPISGGSWDQKLTQRGLLYYNAHSYVLLCRSGIIEWVDAGLLIPSDFTDNKKIVPMFDIEDHILNAIGLSMKFYQKQSIEPQVIYQYKLTKMRGYSSPPNQWGDKYPPLEEEDIILPQIVVNSSNDNLESLCRDGFEILWNALGRKRPLRVKK